MKVCVLASSSSGNCTLLESAEGRVLLDVGLSWSRTASSLASIGVDPFTINAIVISHEHSDHVAGIGPVSRKLKCPIYVAPKTLAFASSRFERVDSSLLVPIAAGRPFEVGDLQFNPFPVPHDAADPLGFVVRNGCAKVGIATDLGYPTKLVRECLKGCNVLVVESNHDKRMLLDGPYPWNIKQRIASRHGHLSNEQSAALLSALVHEELLAVLLSHLSEENNTPEMAFNSAARVLNEANRQEVILRVASRFQPSEFIEAG